MYKKKAFFIVFEGVEGCGKSYQSKKLYLNLKRKKLELFLLENLEAQKARELIRNLILRLF